MAKGPEAAVPNKHRGETAVLLGGTSFVLRADFEAAAAIDEQLGSIVRLLRRALQEPEALTLAELAVIVTEGIRAHGRKTGDVGSAQAGLKKVKQWIFEAGPATVIEPVMWFLTALNTGGVKDEPGNA